MTSAPDAELTKTKAGRTQAILLLVAATLLALGPFIDKPFHIDDPLFVWGAQHIRENFWTRPFDFYGFEVLWSARYEPMHEVTQNPPLALYFLAAASLPGGWNEIWLHAFCLIPAVGVVVGTWRLGRGMTLRPLLAGLVVLCTPIFLISSTNVMCDTLMVCFWVWSVVLWREGLQQESHSRLFAAAVLAGMAVMTKYFAASLIPLLALFTIARERRPVAKLLWLLIPCGILVGYQLWTKHLYGHGLLNSAAEFARKNYQAPGQPLLMKSFSTLAFTGGSLLCLLFYTPRINRWWVNFLGAGLAGVLMWALLHYQPQFLKPGRIRPTSWDLAIQGSLLVVSGLGVIWLMLTDVWFSSGNRIPKQALFEDSPRLTTEPGEASFASNNRNRLADSLLLGAWLGGTLLFAGAINWTVNGRSMLPLVPAAALLLCRGIDRGVGTVMSPFREGWLLIPAAAMTLVATHADYRFATTPREATETLMTVARKNHVTLWFTGHWGFQYYMEQAGARPIHYRTPPLEIEMGDLLVLPENNDVHILSPLESGLIDRYRFLMSNWGSTHQGARCAGFYSDAWGPLPFVLGPEWNAFEPDLPVISANIPITSAKILPNRDIGDAAARETPYDIYRLGRLLKRVTLQRPRQRISNSSPE